MKKIPDDIALVLSGLFVGVLYLWSGLNGIRDMFDWYLLIIPCMIMIISPMVYSSIMFRRKK